MATIMANNTSKNSHDHLSTATSPVMTSCRPKQLSISAPPGYLGLRFDVSFDETEQQGFVYVATVDTNGPMNETIHVGDRLSSVNGVSVVDKDISFVQSLLLQTLTQRQLVVLRNNKPTESQSPTALATASSTGVTTTDLAAPSAIKMEHNEDTCATGKSEVNNKPVPMSVDNDSTLPGTKQEENSPPTLSFTVANSEKMIIDLTEEDNASSLKTQSALQHKDLNANPSSLTHAATSKPAQKLAQKVADNPGDYLKKPPPMMSSDICLTDRTSVTVFAPKQGALGVQLIAGTAATANYVVIKHVKPGSPVSGKLLDGDWISHVNGVSLQGLPMNNAVAKICTPASDAPYRELVVLRRKSQSRGYASNVASSLQTNTSSSAMSKAKRPQVESKRPKKKPKKDEYILSEPGYVSSNGMFYCTVDNDTLNGVAAKLGTDWKAIAALKENKIRYGELKGSSTFRPYTLLCIPEKRSKWKMKQLAMPEPEIELENCVECGVGSNPANLLLCDGCDAHHHVACVGLNSVPKGDWFCHQCLEVLRARKEHGDLERKPYTLPPVPALGTVQGQEEQDQVASLRLRLHDYLQSRRRQDVRALNDNSAAIKTSLEEVVRNCQHEVQRAKEALDALLVDLANRNEDATQYGEQLERTRKSLEEAEEDLEEADNVKRERERQILLKYAILLDEPQLEFELMSSYRARPFAPRFLGMISVGDEADVLALHMLREPEELIIIVPISMSHTERMGDEGGQDTFQPRVGITYGVFACSELFDKKRDDELPLEKNGVRDAQRRLFKLLIDHEHNKGLILSRPCCPPTVRTREDKPDGSHLKCFDLTELVRDCNIDLDLPREPSPNELTEKGFALRDYQQTSLRFMLDKENETSGLGLAGELWHRARFLDPAVSSYQMDFFYCHLTGSFACKIFDFSDDVSQKDASMNRFAMPNGALLGEETGMGKTVIAISLILKNPPPLHRRILPREITEVKYVVNHAEYAPPPQFGSSDALAKCNKISNATLIIVPMTLLSQWQSEVERFVPHLKVMTLHSAEDPAIQDVASKDIIIASTHLFQGAGNNRTKAALFRMVKKIHWHRILVDEAHYNREDHQITRVIGSLSATHRGLITGTPIGADLSDLQGQLRFLRLSPFCRTNFWKNSIADPYKERNTESLRVLRTLLSHIVCRHSKEQTHANGKALLALPPRKVETLLLRFGSSEEQQFYDVLDSENKSLFRKLKHESYDTVAGSFTQLNGLVLAARQACCHVGLISLHKIHRHRVLADEKKKRSGGTSEVPRDLHLKEGEEKTRTGILKLAVYRARATAKSRMMEVVSQFQTMNEGIECSICLDPLSEREVALPSCAHPICSECILSLLSASRGDEASGHCPTCRDQIKRSEVTFLGDAEDAGTFAGKPVDVSGKKSGELQNVVRASVALPCFSVETADVHASVTGAATSRVGRPKLEEEQVKRLVLEKQAIAHTLEEKVLSNYIKAERNVGTKIARLLQEIDTMMRTDHQSKCVVFSQFVDVLDVAGEELLSRGIAFSRIAAGSPQHERADALLEFSSNPNMRVFLLSMRAGAVGLNLTSADHCFIMDVASNSAIEEQAIDRIHRIGQTRPVIVKRFVMEDTVEERIVNHRRKLLSDGPLESTAVSGAVLLESEQSAHRPGFTETGAKGKIPNKERLRMLEKLIGTIDVKKA